MKKHIILCALATSIVLVFAGCTDKKQIQEYTSKLDSVSKSITDKDFNSAEKQLDELLKDDIKDKDIKDKVQAMKDKLTTEKEKADNINKITAIKELVSKGDVGTASKELETLVAKNIKDEDVKKMIDESKIALTAKQDEIKNQKAEEDKKKEDERKKQEARAKGIRPLGELRKKILGEKRKYLIVDKNDTERSFEKAEKYKEYILLEVGTGTIYDSDEKLVEPNVMINGKLAYSVTFIEAKVYYDNGHLCDVRYVGLDGHVYSYDELKEAIKNGKAFYKNDNYNKDGSTISTKDINSYESYHIDLN